ncbi:hypothetical protein OAS39_11265 [Pirellulales bacterium]|nr:hypothetical protein [Pirellulales bacterium]
MPTIRALEFQIKFDTGDAGFHNIDWYGSTNFGQVCYYEVTP